MLFLARMDVVFPESMDSVTKADLQAQEKEYSSNLQRQGLMKGIWRVVGEYANYSIYDVDGRAAGDRPGNHEEAPEGRGVVVLEEFAAE